MWGGGHGSRAGGDVWVGQVHEGSSQFACAHNTRVALCVLCCNAYAQLVSVCSHSCGVACGQESACTPLGTTRFSHETGPPLPLPSIQHDAHTLQHLRRRQLRAAGGAAQGHPRVRAAGRWLRLLTPPAVCRPPASWRPQATAPGAALAATYPSLQLCLCACCITSRTLQHQCAGTLCESMTEDHGNGCAAERSTCVLTLRKRASLLGLPALALTPTFSTCQCHTTCHPKDTRVCQCAGPAQHQPSCASSRGSLHIRPTLCSSHCRGGAGSTARWTLCAH